MDIGAWSCGMVAGLVHDIQTCKELIDRIMFEAEEIIQSRLKYMLEATAQVQKDCLYIYKITDNTPATLLQLDDDH